MERSRDGCICLGKIITNSGDAIKEIYHPHAAMLFRQSRRIRHDDRKESKQQYYNEAVINCPSCGAEVKLNSQEVGRWKLVENRG